jgi:glycosyltransferase involved in cell wall biosynthesis
MRLFYLANIRLPTEKAHGLQIMHNCEAFAAGGAQVTLFAARRINTLALRRVSDPWSHYGVEHTFTIRRVPCLDLFPWLERFSARLAFVIQALTYTLMLWVWMCFRQADVYYSRDVLTLLALSVIKPHRALAYEAHQRAHSRLGRRMQQMCVRRVGTVIAVTGALAAALESLGARRVIAAHDGFRAERFAGVPDRVTARHMLGLPADAFLVGYVGRLHTMQMSKGVDTLVEAIARADRAMTICLVGGPAEMADSLRARWLALGLPAAGFLSPGEVDPASIPAYLAAFDVCAMPLPWTPHFAYDASPLKLFEYMAVGAAIVASDLPAVAEVVRDGESALLVPPSDVEALAAALGRLHGDPALRARLGAAARAEAAHYTWEARARRILHAIGVGGGADTPPLP